MYCKTFEGQVISIYSVFRFQTRTFVTYLVLFQALEMYILLNPRRGLPFLSISNVLLATNELTYSDYFNVKTIGHV